MENDNILWLIKQLNISLDQYGKEDMKSADITRSQSFFLSHLLSKNSRSLYATSLHVESGISKAAISSTLKALKQNGYIIMEADPEDDRKKQIILTEKAYEEERQIQAHLDRQQACLCEGISQHDLRILKNSLNKMISNLKSEYARRNVL